MNTNGAIIYSGPSMIDGMPIICIATGLKSASSNSKTGGEIQTFIIRADMGPRQALDTGADVSVCGDCPHRPRLTKVNGQEKVTRSCYVEIDKSVRSVYACFARGNYRRVTDHGEVAALFAGRKLRLGTYGDPAALPIGLVRAAVSRTAGHTGYTHQWRKRPQLKGYCMASVDSSLEHAMASLKGWRCFRPRGASEELRPGGDRLSCG